MMWAYLTGALAGLGVYLLVRMFIRPSANVLSTIARIDAGRSGYTSAATASAAGERVLGGVDKARETLGRRLEQEANARGWAFGRLRRDLAVMNQPFAAMLATKVFFALGAMVFIPFVLFAASYLGFGAPGATPAIVTLAAMTFAFFLPDLTLRQEAEQRRRDFRHVVGSFLDLVAMNLAGGRGLPEALMTASTIGDHWAMARIRQAPRSAPRCCPGRHRCGARNSRTSRARRGSGRSRCWWRSWSCVPRSCCSSATRPALRSWAAEMAVEGIRAAILSVGEGILSPGSGSVSTGKAT